MSPPFAVNEAMLRCVRVRETGCASNLIFAASQLSAVRCDWAAGEQQQSEELSARCGVSRGHVSRCVASCGATDGLHRSLRVCAAKPVPLFTYDPTTGQLEQTTEPRIKAVLNAGRCDVAFAAPVRR